MANSNRDTSDYVRSAYRRPGHKRPDYGRSKSRGQIWSIIIVLLLIVILAGGAVWMYLGRGGEELEVASTESEALIPQAAAPTPAETEASPPDAAEEEMAATAPSEEASQAEEDEFASILEELGIGAAEEPREMEKAAGTEAEPSETPSEGSAAVVAAPEIPSREQAEEEIIGDLSTPEEQSGMMAQERGGQAADQLDEVAGIASPGDQATRENPESPRLGEASQEIEGLPAVVGSPERGGATAATPPGLAIEGAAPQAPETVTVQLGDSLSVIAQRVYGDPGKWSLIYEANRDLLESPDLVFVGMELTIPPEGG